MNYRIKINNSIFFQIKNDLITLLVKGNPDIPLFQANFENGVIIENSHLNTDNMKINSKHEDVNACFTEFKKAFRFEMDKIKRL